MKDAVTASATAGAHPCLKVVNADCHDHSLDEENDHQPCVQTVNIGPAKATQLTIIITLFIINSFEGLAQLRIRVGSFRKPLVVVVSWLTIIGSLT